MLLTLGANVSLHPTRAHFARDVPRLQGAADLDTATALRLLDVVVREGLVACDAQGKPCTLGPSPQCRQACAGGRR